MRSRYSLPAAVVLFAACDQPLDLESFDQALVRTEASAYTLRSSSRGLEVAIGYSYENRTGSRVYLVNCNGHVAPVLERKIGDGEWELAWAAPEHDCLSPPVVIEPGAALRDTLLVYGRPPGSNSYPQIDPDRIRGVHRLRWNRALTSFEPRLPFGQELPLALRVSNEFLLR
jgi:hypothetical protein